MINKSIDYKKIQEELEQDEKSYIEWKKYLKDEHLGKFQDLDLFFQNAEKELLFYFKNQKEFNNLNDFKKYLKKEINFYIKSFSMERKDRKLIRKELNFIDETYDKIIYFGEFNPLEARRQRLKEKGELSVDVEKEKGFFINILSKILEDIKKESES